MIGIRVRKPKFLKERRKFWSFVLAVVLILLFFRLSFVLINEQQAKRSASTFREKMDQGKVTAAIEIYRRQQTMSTDLSLSESKRDARRKLQLEMEADIRTRMHSLFERVSSGQVLSEIEINQIATLNELSAAQITPLLIKASEDLLDGKFSPDRWKWLISQSAQCPNLRIVTSGLLDQEEALMRMIPLFSKAYLTEARRDWREGWEQWQSLSESKESCRFARDWAKIRLRQFQAREYGQLMELYREYNERGAYYSALQLLEKMDEAFPERNEIDEMIRDCRTKVPTKLQRWFGMVEALSIRPLVVREDIAFKKSGDPVYAANSLITASEFKAMLAELYQRNYVLISPDLFNSWPASKPEILVPEGKTPLLMIFDAWQYSYLNRSCGTTERLELAADGSLSASVAGKQGRELDGLLILEDFLKLHPDFAFNGAKGLVALCSDENSLGYLLNEAQYDQSSKVYKSQGLEITRPGRAQLENQQETVAQIMDKLKLNGWVFASAGNSGVDFARLSNSEIQKELDLWFSNAGRYTAVSSLLSFPAGGNIYQDEGALKLLLNAGFKVFFGIGPKAYNIYGQRTVHIDRTPVSGFTMLEPGWDMLRFFDPAKVRNSVLRQ